MRSRDSRILGVFRVQDLLIGVPIENLSEVCAVPTMSPLMTSDDAVLGAFELRGNMIPLVDCLGIARAGKYSAPVKKAAIVQHEDQIVAFAIDEIITLCPAPQVVPQEDERGRGESSDESSAHTLYAGGFVMDGGVVNCLDARALLTRVSHISVVKPQKSRLEAGLLHQDRFLVFSAGRAKFAISTSFVWATVPRRTLSAEGVVSDGSTFLGFTHHNNTRIPVADSNMVLGLGDSSRSRDTEVIVLHTPENLLFGLHVDTVERIVSIDQNRIQPTVAFLGRDRPLKQVFVEKDGTQLFIIDYTALSERSDIKSLSELSIPEGDTGNRDTSRSAEPENTASGKGGYLIFEAGYKRAVSARQIIRILEMPGEVVPANDMPTDVVGFFSYANESIPLITLADGSAVGPPEYTLIVSCRDKSVAVAATKICGVSSSARVVEASQNQADQTPLVQVNENGAQSLVSLIDLEELATTLIHGA